jgi:PAS domain S-box-containing protein
MNTQPSTDSHSNVDQLSRFDLRKWIPPGLRNALTSNGGGSNCACESVSRSSGFSQENVKENNLGSSPVVFPTSPIHKCEDSKSLPTQSDPELRRIFDARNEAVLVFDVHGRLTTMNKSATALLKWSIDEKSGSTGEFIFEDRSCFENFLYRIEEAFGANKPLVEHYRTVRKGGTTFPAEHTVTQLIGANDTVLGMVCAIRDLSEDDRQDGIRYVVSNISEAALKLDSVEDLCAHIHEQIGTLLDARNFFVALYHADRKMYTLPYIVDQYDDDEFSKSEEFTFTGSMTDYVRRTGEPQLADLGRWAELEAQEEIELIGTQSFHWMGLPLKSREGVSGVVVIQTYDPEFRYSDEHFELMIRVSEQIGYAVERKRAEQNLRASEARSAALLSAIPDLMLIINNEGLTTDYNVPSSYELRIPPEKFFGRHLTEVLPADVALLTLTNLKKVLSTGVPIDYEYTIFEGEEEETSFEARMVPHNDCEVLMLVREITEQKAAEREKIAFEQQLQHTQKLESLGVLAGGIAHDFNNLLVGILGNANLALERMNETAPERNLIDNIHRAAMRAADLTRQMLAYSGKGAFVIEPLDLSNAIGEMYHLLEVSISKHCKLVCDYSDDVPMVNGDATQIRQVVMNLITNASDAIGDRTGTISIRTGKMRLTSESIRGVYMDTDLEEGQYSYVEVSDTGSGMSKETMDKMFDPFFTTKFTGRGLGLAAVLGIVRSHKGAFKVYSELGKGTTIRFLLPASDQVAECEDEGAEAKMLNVNGAAKLMIVDDDETVREVATMMLEGFGYNVVTAIDGLDACEQYTEYGDEIDLVILDMTMPRMDGEETFARLRELDPEVKVVLSSGYNEQDAMSNFNSDGLSGFLQKPYQLQELIGQVQRSLDMKE